MDSPSNSYKNRSSWIIGDGPQRLDKEDDEGQHHGEQGGSIPISSSSGLRRNGHRICRLQLKLQLKSAANKRWRVLFLQTSLSPLLPQLQDCNAGQGNRRWLTPREESVEIQIGFQNAHAVSRTVDIGEAVHFHSGTEQGPIDVVGTANEVGRIYGFDFVASRAFIADARGDGLAGRYWAR
jgi:hypothetical protein